MSDTVLVCPDCDQASLSSCGRSYWCHECGQRVDRDAARERPAREWARRAPTVGLAAKLDAADPDEVGS